MTTRLLQTYDYKYETRLWRKDVAETFQPTKKIKTEYRVDDGQVIETVETTWEYASAKAERTNQLPDPPGGSTFLYIDGNYHADRAAIFQKTHIIDTTYEALGDTAYQVTVEDEDVLNHTRTRRVTIIDGKIPAAQTLESSLTALVQQPITGVLDDNCDFVPSIVVIDNGYLQDDSEAATASRRAMQRATAIARRLKQAANPLMKIGHTVRLIIRKRGIDARHMLTRRSMAPGPNGIGQDQQLELECWQR